ncbi:cytochrome P450 6k1-like [Diachasma alloeum]|uniref:cytochrome P450 6k1-like n=1 Tax=Diachasma alloeum TaxID=454923 RepID=UPI0007385140|nr:cytochrome P450 6k1-like [Diachasma alloeum]
MIFAWNHWMMYPIIFLTLITYLAYRYMTRNFDYWKKRGVVSVPPTPFLGNFGGFLTGQKSGGKLLQEIYNYAPDEPYVGFFGFDKPLLVIRDTNLIKHILIKDFDHFQDRYTSSGDYDLLGRASLFMIKNPAWKYVRTKMSSIYTSGRLKKMVQLLVEVAQDLVTHLESLDLKGPGRTVEMKELCARFTTDMIATTAFGLRANSLNDPNAEFRERGKELFMDTWYRSIEQIANVFAPFLVTPLRFYSFPKKFSAFLRVAVWDAINQREKSGNKRHDLIDLLIELKNQEDNSAYKDIFEFKGDNIVAQAAVFFLGGFETSSTTLSFSLYELAVHPEMQIRLRKEITDAVEVDGGEITYETIMQLPYLDMVVLEALRKYPSLPFLDRVATSNYSVPGTDLVIEKGTPVYIPLLGLHYDPKYHENPDKFDPERFSEARRDSSKRAWYPFGDGPHVCIGLRLGLLQVKVGLIEMLRNYEFSPCDKTAIPMVLAKKGLNVAAEGGVYLNIKELIK